MSQQQDKHDVAQGPSQLSTEHPQAAAEPLIKEYIVVLKDSTNKAAHMQWLKSHIGKNDILDDQEEWNDDFIKGYVIRAGLATHDLIKAMPEVQAIEENVEVTMSQHVQ